ncbi:MAG: carbohydrate-binding protein [Acidobacteria bacterium]|nr:carbohydrate-binding protein [Acidobacteriota bacterium]
MLRQHTARPSVVFILGIVLSILAIIAADHRVADAHKTQATPLTWVPQGKIESIDDQGFVKGWAVDPNNPSASVTVRVYIDGQAEANFFEQIVAGQERPDLASLGYGTAHGFRVQVPTPLMEDGTQHTLYAFAVNTTTGEQAALPDVYGSQSFVFPFLSATASGPDLGAAINSADAYLRDSGRRGMIHIYGGGTISTQATLSPRHTLRLHAGNYQPSLVGPAILLKNNTAIVGDGWATVIKENSTPQNWIVITNDGAWPVPLSEPNYDITLKDFKVEGHDAQPLWSAQGPVVLGNVKRAVVSGIWFDSPHAFGVAVGAAARRSVYYGPAAEKAAALNGGSVPPDPDGGQTDINLFAENVWIVNNKFTRVASQNASTVNARLATVANNFFEKPGQPGGPGVTLIDIEPNTANDLAEYTIIENNQAFTNESAFFPHGNYIAYQPAHTERGGPALIRGNRLNSKETISIYTSNGIIMKPESRDIIIRDNKFYGTSQSAVYAGGNRLYIHGNLFDSTGGGGIESVRFASVFDSLFFNNTFKKSAQTSAANNIIEWSPSDRNIHSQNTNAVYQQLGPNSRVQRDPPPIPFTYPRVTKPQVTRAADDRVEISAPTTVPVRVMTNGQFSTVQLNVNPEIHYTLDGTEPTLFSPRYYGPLKVSATARVTAKAFMGGLIDSFSTLLEPTSTPYPSGVPQAVPGTIQAEHFDIGGEGLAFHDAEAQNLGYVFRVYEGVDIAGADDPDGGDYYVGWAYAGEWLKYTVEVARTGSYTLAVRSKGVLGAGGTFHIEADGVDVTGPMQVPHSDTWQTVTKAGVKLSGGRHVLRLVLDTPSAQVAVGNFNYIRVTEDHAALSGTALTVPGTIQVEDFDVGAQGFAYFDNSAGNLGYQYRYTDVDIAITDDPAGGYYYVGWAHAGEWLKYTIEVPQTGAYDIEARVAGNFNVGGTFHIEFDGVNVTGPMQILNSNDWHTVTKANVTLNAGQHVMRIMLDVNHAQAAVGNFNFVRITEAQ